MKVLTLARSYLEDKTVGWLKGDGVDFVTLELRWANNEQNVSCIPEGCYLLKRDKTGRHQWYSVQDVEGRTFIELHEAHSTKDLLGCIGLGISFDDEYNLRFSNKALIDLNDAISDDDCILHIRAATKDDF